MLACLQQAIKIGYLEIKGGNHCNIAYTEMINCQGFVNKKRINFKSVQEK
jgi:hypothetical protein